MKQTRSSRSFFIVPNLPRSGALFGHAPSASWGRHSPRYRLSPTCSTVPRPTVGGSGPPAWLWPACLALARLPGSGPPAGVTLRPEARHIDVLGGCPAGDRLTAERSYETRKAGGDSRNPVTGRRGAGGGQPRAGGSHRQRG